MVLPPAYAAPVTIAVCATRDRARSLARAAFPRRRCRLALTRSAAELERTFRETLIDAVVVDVHAPTDDSWKAVGLAAEFPSAPFFALTPLRPGDAPVAARCAAADVTDLVTEGVDDGVLRELVLPRTFTARFTEALREPPPSLGLSGQLHHATWRFLVAHGVLRELVLPRTFTARFTEALREPPPSLGLSGQLHHATWRFLVAHGGRAVRTDTIAAALGITREHLSRAFSAGGSANLKRIIDLVRLIAAAELAKNPGYDVSDVARVLDYASSSHLSTTSQRIAGTKPASLARLRAVDLIDRFVKGRTRSRG